MTRCSGKTVSFLLAFGCFLVRFPSLGSELTAIASTRLVLDIVGSGGSNDTVQSKEDWSNKLKDDINNPQHQRVLHMILLTRVVQPNSQLQS